MAGNLDDDETPPDLVDVAAMPAGQPASIEEEQTPRVPITLVTGMFLSFHSKCKPALTSNL